MVVFKLILITSYLTVITCSDSNLEDEEIRGAAYIKQLNAKAALRYKQSTEAEWAYETNITEFNLKNMVAIQTQLGLESKQDWLETIKFHWKSFRDPDLRRQFKMYSLLGSSALSSEKFEEYMNIIGNMKDIYSSVEIPAFPGTENASEPTLDIGTILAKSRNPDELKHVWVEWRKAVGPKIRKMYEKYVDLANEAARLNNFTDNSDAWLYDFESDDIKEQFHNLWEQIRPLYSQIHAYVRYKLRQIYGDIVSERGPIPAHLLGNLVGEVWTNLVDITLPNPNTKSPTVTEEMVKQGYAPHTMFQLANDFFVSLNLTAMPASFWQKSVLEKPNDGRKLVCNPWSWDFFDQDVRMRICTTVTETELYLIHHEMGHMEYFLQYASQPVAFRDGANSGFHEAIGDVIALSVSTPKHLQKIGLLNETNIDAAVLLNSLYKISLEKIVLLPFGYVTDLWRWDVFSGKISKDDMNCKWWELIHKYQGVEPPVDRSEIDFDPGAKYHIIADVPFIRYFVSHVIQFQIHRALCLKAGEYDPNDPSKPINNCDIYQNTVAGNALGDMLQKGCSKPWPDIMEALTGQRNMDASALLEYFKPLQTWLEEENKKNGVYVGWEPTKRVCSSSKKGN